MRVLQWISQNWELICICFGIAVNAAGLFYNIYKFWRSGNLRTAQKWLLVLEAAREYEMEAERYENYTAAEKLQYVLSRLRVFTAEMGLAYDEGKLTEQVRADIAFSKEVNAAKSQESGALD